MLIDTHAHINFSSFNEDREKIIKKSIDNDIWMINVGTNLKTSQEVIDIAEKYPEGVYAAVGLHPINLDTGLVKIKFDKEEGESLETDFDYDKYKNMAQSERVVAIGEIGLDYYWKPKTNRKKALFKQKQKDLLLKQIDLAKDLDLPIIFHCRMALDDLLEILKAQKNIRGVIHCFTGTWEQAKQYMDMGFYIGVDGIIFKLNLDEVIKKIPLERILVETDCPYLSPPEFENQRNQPLYVKYVAQRVAELKGIDFDVVAETTTQNAKALFCLN